MKNLIRVGIVGLVLLASLLPCLTISPSVSATGNVSYGMWDFLSSPTAGNVNASCVNWFCASNFDWIVYPYGTNGTPSIMADTLYAAGKDIILRTWFLGDVNISTGHKTWTDLKTNSSLYNSALATIENQINTVGESYLYAVTINEEEPDDGYWGGAVNVSDFITVHNHMYADLKLEYPTLKVFPFINIDDFTDGELATLDMDGLVADMYSANVLGTITPFFTRMMSFGGNETYCIMHASSNYAPWAALITPTILGVTEKTAEALSVPHLGWFAYDFSTSPHKSILFNNWPVCSDLNSANCSGNLKNAILNILNGVSFDAQIVNDNDDAWAKGDNSSLTTGTDWFVLNDDSGTAARGSGFRFVNISIPVSVNITSSFLALAADTANPVLCTMNGTIYGHNSSASGNFVTNPYIYDTLNRSRTSANTTWSQIMSANVWNTSPQVRSIIQEIANIPARPTVLPITLLVLGSKTLTIDNFARGVGFDSIPYLSATLHIEYQTTPQAQTKTSIVINGTSATLNGRIYSDGGLTTQGRFYYGTSATYTSNTSLAGSMNMADTFTYSLGSLNKGQHYHYMASSTNALGTGNGSDGTFITYPDAPNTVTVAAINSSALTVSFNKGTGAVTTAITRKAGSYPVNPLDGTVAYLGSGITFNNTGLTPSTDYYYRGWSVAIDGGLTATSLTNGSGHGATNAPPAAPTSIGGTMGTIIVIVLSFLIVIMLLGYSINEYSKNGFNENTKVAIAGIITIIIAETILIAFF